MSLNVRVALATFGFAALSGLALAQPPGGPDHRKGPPAEMVAKYDANKDGKLDESERTKMHADRKSEMLARHDRNKDGKLDEQERTEMHNAKLDETFQKLDTDRNGVLSKAEFAAGAAMGHRPGRGPGAHKGDR